MNIFLTIIGIETLLLVLAVILGWYLDIQWWYFKTTIDSIIWAISGLIVLLSIGFIVTFGALRNHLLFKWYKGYLKEIFVPFANSIPKHLIWVAALLAAIGEEPLFRGVIQHYWGLIPAALIFTVLHAPPIPKLLPLSVFYLGFSFLLGLLFIYTDENILLLIAVHFIYDWVVLYLLQRINFKNNLLNA